MAGYILKRLLLMIPTLFGVMVVTFIVIQFVPGGPVEQLISQMKHRSAASEAGGGVMMPLYRGDSGLDAERLEKLKALYGFDCVVRSMPSTAWSNPSPCEGWSARDVVGHVIAVQGYVESLARGAEPTLNPYGSPGGLAGEAPMNAWSSARESVLDALDAGVLEHTVQTFRAEETIDNFLAWNVVDTLAHTWDLARAGGVDDHLDEDLIAHATRQAAPVIEAMRQPPFFSGAVVITDDPSPAAQFLALLGRRVS